MAMATLPAASIGDISEHCLKRDDTFVEHINIEKNVAPGSGYVMTTYHSYSSEHTKSIEKKLLRRIDRRIMPLVVLIYIFSYLDRNSVSRATSSHSGFNANDMNRLLRLVCMVSRKTPMSAVQSTTLLLRSSQSGISSCSYRLLSL